MHGTPAWAPGFSHPTYANPQAPKGGRLTQGVLGTFDSLNPLIVKGLPAQNIRGYIIESLLARGYDEPFTLYGLLARSVETNPTRSYVAFELNPAARFSDGRAVTAQDVIFSWQLLRDRGRPNHRLYYSKVKSVTADGRMVRFDLTGADDRELPLILGLMPVLARHAIDSEKFEDTSFEPPLGSGPYTVTEVKPGDSVTFRRDPDYWGRDLPINRGLWNFDEIRFDYYRDGNTHLEAFKKGLYDVRTELDPNRWQAAYDFPAARQGKVVKETFPYGLPKGMLGYVFNTRRPLFADIRVREALLTLFDFEWINHNFFFDLYRRTGSYFDGSELSARGVPASDAERKLLAPFPDAVRADVMEGRWSPAKSDGSGRDRTLRRRALALFEEAGYVLKGTQLVARDGGQPFRFEFMAMTREQERVALAYANQLKRVGVTMQVRSIDATQFERRRIAFDFDMMEYRWEQSLSPGNEQSFYWGSEAASQDGSRNYMGVKSKAIDAMIGALLAATEREDFVAAVRALDRVLMSGFYVIPLYHLPGQWIARWTAIRHPSQTSLFGYLPETWWRGDSK
ncbi:extracellular solute-binding protein [Pseudolabrys sp.]|uniref:extracellular solute-binding protein n=1 Tax=Pseudolabrys sp. TaxID=1960880 RepID=UPI003D102AD0